MSVWKSTLIWILSFVLMAGFAIYQRMTGPTYSVSGKITIKEQKISYNLPRSSSGSDDAVVNIIAPIENISGRMSWKKYVSGKEHLFEWTTVDFQRFGDTLRTYIPGQPAAGKIMYNIALNSGGVDFNLTKKPLIIRFKGEVPDFVLILHIIFIFGAMLLSTRTGFEALFKGKNVYKLTMWTVIILFIGGLVFGPIIQKYAFDAYWTGWPFGKDLTDNKTLVSWIMWVVALWRLKKKPDSRGWAIAAASMLIVIFLIPHSVLGSELDYTEMDK